MWITLANYGEIAVDVTIISAEALIRPKEEKALNRGVIPLFIARSTILRAQRGDERALSEIRMEIDIQIPLRLKKLHVSQMTAELAAHYKRNPQTISCSKQGKLQGSRELVGVTA